MGSHKVTEQTSNIKLIWIDLFVLLEMSGKKIYSYFSPASPWVGYNGREAKNEALNWSEYVFCHFRRKQALASMLQILLEKLNTSLLSSWSWP